MERNEFLKSLGLGIMVACAGNCLSACSKGGESGSTPVTPTPPPSGTTVNVDLSTKLLNVGDQFSTGNVLFIRIAGGNVPSSFIATESVCPHQGGQLQWINNQNRIQCQLHFSEYSTNGSVIQGPQNSTGTTRALKVYTTTVSGNTLTATT